MLSIHPGIRLEDILENTGFELLRDACVPETEPPTSDQLRLIREVIDPNRIFVN